MHAHINGPWLCDIKVPAQHCLSKHVLWVISGSDPASGFYLQSRWLAWFKIAPSQSGCCRKTRSVQGKQAHSRQLRTHPFGRRVTTSGVTTAHINAQKRFLTVPQELRWNGENISVSCDVGEQMKSILKRAVRHHLGIAFTSLRGRKRANPCQSLTKRLMAGSCYGQSCVIFMYQRCCWWCRESAEMSSVFGFYQVVGKSSSLRRFMEKRKTRVLFKDVVMHRRYRNILCYSCASLSDPKRIMVGLNIRAFRAVGLSFVNTKHTYISIFGSELFDIIIHKHLSTMETKMVWVPSEPMRPGWRLPGSGQGRGWCVGFSQSVLRQ